MPLHPINFVHLGDGYRFYVDFSVPTCELSHIERYENGFTHADRIEWDEVPQALKLMLFEHIQHHHASLEV